MPGKLQDYQVLDVLCGGTFYKVRHKVTNDVFAWKAYDFSAYSPEQIQSVAADVRTINKARGRAAALLRLHDTVLHAPSRTLYFVLELGPWRSLASLLAERAVRGRRVAEAFAWHLLLQLARVCRALQGARLAVLRPRLAPAGILVEEGGAVRVHCCEPGAAPEPALRQLGAVLRSLCAAPARQDQFSDYSDDLVQIISFLTDDKNANLSADVILYHPTVLTNIETFSAPKCLSDILVPVDCSSAVNKCDSEKAVELCKTVKPAPRLAKTQESPIYCNITPKKFIMNRVVEESNSPQASISPTIAALALELPGFVPRSRKAIRGALETYNTAQQVSENTLSQQWMSRLITLRRREESLNKRERDLIAKEIINSPAAKIIPLRSPNESLDAGCGGSNGITLPAMLSQAEDRSAWVSRRHTRTSSVRLKSRRKTFHYEDLDSSLSADNGDSSMIITASKITKDNMPRNLFPEPARKVHFTPANPFVESDDSVTLTFYELENVDKEGYQVPRQQEKVFKDINKFKYLDLEKMTTEKRAAMPWSHSSPSKQAKIADNMFSDVTNTKYNLRKTPSKSSLTSKGSNMSRFSLASGRSQWSVESLSKAGEGSVSERTRASIRQTLAETPVAPDSRRKSRKSLLPFKTPFKFMSSTKI